MSENSSKIGKYQFVAEPFHVDFTGRLTMGVLGNHLLNCAGFHASDRGFGIATLNEDNYTWVLSRLAIELDEMPYQYEDFTIWTWVENVYRLFTDRNFALLDKDGKKIGYARSVWAMINLNTRKPADLLALHGGSIVDYVCDEPCPIEKPSRIKVSSTEPVATLKAKYSDIDITYPLIKIGDEWKIFSLDDTTVKVMCANFKNVKDEISSQLNDDSSDSSSDASADSTEPSDTSDSAQTAG